MTLLVDRSCPMCSREAAFLTRLDRHGRLAFEDTSAVDFAPEKFGISSDPNRMIHAVMADGTVIQGLEVFRQAYKQVGLGWLLAPTAWPVLRPIFDRAYLIFARNRKAIGRLFGKRCKNANSC